MCECQRAARSTASEHTCHDDTQSELQDHADNEGENNDQEINNEDPPAAALGQDFTARSTGVEPAPFEHCDRDSQRPSKPEIYTRNYKQHKPNTDSNSNRERDPNYTHHAALRGGVRQADTGRPVQMKTGDCHNGSGM